VKLQQGLPDGFLIRTRMFRFIVSHWDFRSYKRAGFFCRHDAKTT
jgi:hypothetical protein